MKDSQARTAPPKSWPATVTYITEPVYSKLLTVEQLENIQSSTHQPVSLSSSAATWEQKFDNQKETAARARIVAVTDRSHPAYGQSALVASKALVPDSHILDFIGFVHDETDTDPSSDYDLSLERECGIAVDAAKMGNEARYINDYRGICADGPNAEFRERWVAVSLVKGGKRSTVWQKRIAVYVLSAGKDKRKKRAKGIAKDEEILVSYGKGFWAERRVDETGAEDAREGA